MTIGRGLGVAAIVVPLLFACASPSGRADPSVRRAYNEAVAAAGEGPAAGIAALEAFLAAHGRSPLADDAGLRLGRLLRDNGDEEAARIAFASAIVAQPRGDRTDAVRLELARLEQAAGRLDDAAITLQDLRLSLLKQDERHEAHRLLAEISGARGEVADQLRWLARVADDGPADASDAAEARAERDRILQSLAPEALETVAEDLGRRRPAAAVRLEQARRARQRGDRASFDRAVAALRRLPLAPDEADALATLRSASGVPTEETGDLALDLPERGTGAGPVLAVGPVETTIGVVVPLQGGVAPFGREALQGVLLAAGLFDAERQQRSGVQVVVRDAGSGPDAAAAAVRELAQDPQVDAVIGPILGDRAEAAAGAAPADLPLLVLTRREGVGRNQPNVLRLGASPRVQVAYLADVAIRELGVRRFAILYPNDAYGRVLRARFWDAVESRGGVVAGVARYAPDATDFSASVRKLIGYDLLGGGAQEALRQRERLLKRAKRRPPAEAAELRAEAAALTGPNGTPLPPFVDFDALFIPDSHENVSLIAPHLAFHEVRGVRLLGPSGWHHPELLRIGGRHVDGAIFTSDYYGESASPFVAEFHRRFEAAFGRPPGALAAQAFDAANLAILQRAQGADDRGEVLSGLHRTRNWPGVSGVVTIPSSGDVRKRPHLLGIERGEILSIDEQRRIPTLRGARIPSPAGPAEAAEAE